MPLLLDLPTAGHDVAQLIERWRLDPADFRIRRIALRDGACFAEGQLLVTVANGRARASRTYVSRTHPAEWMLEFEQDLRAGVFSPLP